MPRFDLKQRRAEREKHGWRLNPKLDGKVYERQPSPCSPRILPIRDYCCVPSSQSCLHVVSLSISFLQGQPSTYCRYFSAPPLHESRLPRSFRCRDLLRVWGSDDMGGCRLDLQRSLRAGHVARSTLLAFFLRSLFKKQRVHDEPSAG